MRLPVVVLIVVAVATSAGMLWWSSSEPEPAPVAAEEPARVGERAPSASASAVVGQGAAPGAASYVEVARMFEIGFAGGVIVSEDTRSSIDAALAALSDPPTEQEMQAFEKVLTASLPYVDAQKVLALTKGYAGYASELKGELEKHGLPQSMADFDASMARVSAVRERHFDPATAQALFGPHDGYARITFEASFVAMDGSLSFEQKRERMAELRAKLPEAQRSLIPEPQP